VILASVGHLHYDYEARYKHTLHVMCPSLEMNPKKGFKHYLVYKNQIVIKTYELQNGQYHFANKWQMVKIPAVYEPKGDKKIQQYISIPNSEIVHLEDATSFLHTLSMIQLRKIYEQWIKNGK
jgi:hypothetical protein